VRSTVCRRRVWRTVLLRQRFLRRGDRHDYQDQRIDPDAAHARGHRHRHTSSSTTYSREAQQVHFSAVKVGEVVAVRGSRSGTSPTATSPIAATAITIEVPSNLGRVQSVSGDTVTLVTGDGQLAYVTISSSTGVSRRPRCIGHEQLTQGRRLHRRAGNAGQPDDTQRRRRAGTRDPELYAAQFSRPFQHAASANPVRERDQVGLGAVMVTAAASHALSGAARDLAPPSLADYEHCLGAPARVRACAWTPVARGRMGRRLPPHAPRIPVPVRACSFGSGTSQRPR